ncbi:MarR family winged helix-turn-helix transcriptional regulator [Angustibacter sp. Root456]|uniref:MarR family winged helix-turn-helix transcriptional regulator n=1 Tax=Angustibacter sp. Root456 TaxID=1736539 RepID=UPI000A977754|nr:MarR family transcriptional regulator [Angustibacter sp. Root456]
MSRQPSPSDVADEGAAPPPAAAHAASSELSAQVVRLTRQVAALRAHLTNRARHGVEWSAYVVLFHLVKAGAMRSSALAEMVCSDPSTISRQTASLVEHGLVERRPDPDDGRAVQLAATDAGRALFDQMRAERDGLIASVLVDWDPADVATLAHLLDRFTTDLERHRPRLLKTLDSLETA